MTKENPSSTGVLENERVVEVLNELLETARDGEFGFQACADEVAAPNLQQVFYHRAEQCHEAADELVLLIWRFGGTPAEGGTARGAIHRRFVRHAAAGAGSDLSMLDECERREDVSVARYHKALKQNLPPEARRVVERRAQNAQRNYAQIRDLRFQSYPHRG
ncbi:PA2169 family four-helix-bundle protein [Variovorax sp. RKNM96]|uniref:ferritin-like domain-containing protein n=1 Tax=Variovorax sp. RKNM96 TaxID=2681552 RepID=UPI00197E7C60|nr:PA2169 family four-helix-bundle protein [Variovorax sp. RKNM96]QSI31068.1 PA2169 family four-helix-bundle protein [Variovorax sp. RKNM96]